jgi:hypothetical protein
VSFLSLTTALIAAGLAVPLLLLLYFLKLRRQDRKVSSTLMWKKAVRDLQVNAPFQKLRRNLLLFLQLLILAAVLFGMANPVANFLKRPERNIVLLIDQSASMSTLEADGRTRIEHAKQAAMEFVDTIQGESRAMVIGFSDRANVVSSFTHDKRRLYRLIEQIEPTDGPSNISEAIQLAEAYSTKLVSASGEGWDPDSIEMADIEVFSDCRIADAAEGYVSRGEMHGHIIGAAADNAGIVGFDVRRDLERPGMLSVFAQVQNFGPTAVESHVSLSLDGRLLSVQDVTLGPARSLTTRAAAGRASDETTPAARNVIFELRHEAGGVIEVELNRKDALPLDNVVSAPIDPPRALRVLVVTDRKEVRFIMDRLFRKAFELDDITIMSTSEYEDADDDVVAMEGRSAFDLIVVDNHDTGRLLPGNYVFFNGVPQIDDCSLGEDVHEQVFVSWQESHPLLRHVSLENVFALKWRRLTLPSHAALLAEGEDSTAIAFITDPGHRYVITAFDLLDSDFRMQYAFIVFMQNAMFYLASGGLTDTGLLITPGDTMTLAVPPGAETMRLTRPDGSTDDVEVRDRLTINYANTRKCGLYKAVFDDPAETAVTYATNVLDANESMIAPNANFTIAGNPVRSVAGDIKINEPLWPWAVAAALAILLIEWWIYNRRVMI